MRIYVILIAVILSLYSCSNNAQDLVKINQVDSDYPIIVRSNNKQTFIDLIEFPLVFEINKSSLFKKIRLSMPSSYYYYYIFISNKKEFLYFSSNVNLYMLHNSSLEEYDYQDNISIGNIKQKYIFYTKHYMIDTTQAIQKLFSSYIAKMKALGKDTLHIASIQELKKTNPELLNTFLKGDSIYLYFYYDELYHPIKLPVEIK